MSNFMENKDSLAKKASYLRIAAAELAEGMKEGNFRSLYRGQGIEFSGVRDYIRGDDIRAIDWNVTARMGRPYIKVFEEERELQIFLIVDTSLSMQLGSGKRTKFHSVAESIALLSMAAEMNSCPLGAVFFDGEIQFSCAPEHGRERTMVILKQLEDLPQKAISGSVLNQAITGATKILRKRALIFIFSDFRTADWEQPLAQLAHKNDVIAINVKDKFDQELPSIGSVPFIDCESSKTMVLPSSSEKFKKAWSEYNESGIRKWQDICVKRGVFPAILKTTDEPLKVLSEIFARQNGSSRK